MGITDRRPLPADNPKRIYSLIEDSVNFVNEHAGKRPFYMMVSHYAVHVKHAASQKYLDKWQAKYDALPNKPTDSKELYNFRKERKYDYAAMLEEADQNLGLLIDALEAKGELDNTYIMFTSDNGSECVARDAQNRRFNGPLQEGKYSAFEGGIRVPFIVSGPGIQGGAQCDAPIVQWDLLPTLHALSSNPTPLPEYIDGGSLADVFIQRDQGAINRRAPGLVFHFPSYYQVPLSCIRIGDFKFLRNMNTNEMKLFNVKDDYREQHDLAASMPEKVSEMDKILRNYIDEVDGGDVTDVYQAIYETLDDFEKRNETAHKKRLEALDASQPVDLEAQRAKLIEAYETKKRSYYANREIIKRQETWPDWYTTSRKTVEAEIGMTKGGKILKKK
jgi:arylsulfatase A-like enzyme